MSEELQVVGTNSFQSVISVIERAAKDPTIDIDKMERLMAMAERMESRHAEKEFIAAFNRLQKRLPTIVAKTVIPNRGKYQKFEDVMEEIGPLLHDEGFAVSFSMDVKDNRVLETCHLRHLGGHSQSNSFAVRVGKADTECQADCKAATTAKRNALLNALNVIIRQDCLSTEDDDATIEGDPNAKITPAQAEELERRAQLTNSNLPAFLKFAGATSFRDIPSTKYSELDSMLARKEKGGK